MRRIGSGLRVRACVARHGDGEGVLRVRDRTLTRRAEPMSGRARCSALASDLPASFDASMIDEDADLCASLSGLGPDAQRDLGGRAHPAAARSTQTKQH